jgi:hypothetical protein
MITQGPLILVVVLATMTAGLVSATTATDHWSNDNQPMGLERHQDTSTRPLDDLSSSSSGAWWIAGFIGLQMTQALACLGCLHACTQTSGLQRTRQTIKEYLRQRNFI